jgi:threonine dehydrogenase-like Zn-dependent dehydrogenase
MRALVWTAPRELILREEPEPQPGADEILVEVVAAGICGSELSGYLGESSIRVPPLVMGHEAAGRIAADSPLKLGDGSPARAGARVTFNPLITCGSCDRCRAGRESLCRQRQLIGAHRPGAYAPLVAVPAAQCFTLPPQLSETAGSLTEPLACAVRAVAQTRANPEEPLLILGAGPIGLCCLVAARAAGFNRIAISDIAPGRLALARRWGAEQAFDARTDDVVAAAQRFAPGGVPAVIDAVGTSGTRAQALRAAMPGGRIVFIGLHAEESPLEANYLVRNEIEIAGTFAYTPREFARALELLASGALQPSDDWLEERPLAAGPDSFEELIAGRAAAAKIVLRLG